MNSERRILLNAATLAAGQVVGQLANLLFVVVFARHYGAALMGDYSLAMATGAVASLAVSLGTHGYLLRELSREPQLGLRYISLLAPAQLFATLVVWLGATAITVALNGAASGAVILVTVGYQVMYRYSALFYLPFRAAERMWTTVLADLIHRALTLVAGVALMAAGATAATTLSAMFASAGLLALAGWVLHERSFGVAAPRFAPRELGQLLVNAGPFFSVLLLSVLYARGGPILLGALGDRAELGAYAAADRILVASTLLPIMLASAAYPALTRSAAKSMDELRALTGRLLRLMLIGGLSSAGFLIVFAHDLLDALFGQHYAIAVPALQLLALSVPLQAAEQLVSGQLSAMGRQSTLVRIRSAALVAFLCLAPLAILQWSLTGLAATVLGCSLLQLCCGLLSLRRMRSMPLSATTVIPPFAAVTAVLVLLWFASNLALWPRLLLFSLGLVAALWLSRAVVFGDLLFIRAMIRHKP